MLDHFDVETNGGTGVAMREQILDEGNQNYGKVITRYALTGKGAFENLRY